MYLNFHFITIFKIVTVTTILQTGKLMLRTCSNEFKAIMPASSRAATSTQSSGSFLWLAAKGGED